MAEPQGQVVDQSPIINDPYREPEYHWEFGEGEPRKRAGRRPSGYLPPGAGAGQLAIISEVVPLDLVNDLRDRVRQWREDGYPGTTAVTKDLLDRVQANTLISKLAPIVGGKGGGKPDLAQAGGKDADKLNEALERAPGALRELLSA